MKSNEWYTPAKYIEAAREVMGSIDLDPASCALANETVKATKYYTKEEDGLTKEWYGNVWLNPPFGRIHGKSTIGLFVARLLAMHKQGNVPQAILLVHAKHTDRWFQPLWKHVICFVDHHLQFIRPDGTTKDQMFGVAFFYLGPHEDRFIRVFSEFGTIARRVEVPA